MSIEDDLLEQIQYVPAPVPKILRYEDIILDDTGERYVSLDDFLEPYIAKLGRDFVDRWKLKL